MRNEDDIRVNTAHDMKSICRAAQLNDNARQTRNSIGHEFESPGEQQFLLTTRVLYMTIGSTWNYVHDPAHSKALRSAHERVQQDV